MIISFSSSSSSSKLCMDRMPLKSRSLMVLLLFDKFCTLEIELESSPFSSGAAAYIALIDENTETYRLSGTLRCLNNLRYEVD